MNRSPRILIVEDEMVVALDLERRLRKLGYEICGLVATGADAVRESLTHRPDLVLMDICLSGEMDGIEASARIQEGHDVPIVYLSANADENTLNRARTTHPASYLLKPFRERELHICLEMALVNHRLQRELHEAKANLEKRVAERTAELAATNEALRQEMRVREETQANLREHAALLDKARDAILVRNIAGEILFWNRSAERLYGIAQPEALGKKVDEMLAEQPYLESEEPLSTTLEKGEWVGELVQVSGGRQDLIVESRWTLVKDGTGQPTSILVVNTDVTERKRIEAQFLRAQRLESVGALASGIAHDLNNVFTPLIMSAQTLEEEPEGEGVKSLAQIILSSAQRGAAMVKQVLTFVRGAQGEHGAFRVEHLAKELQRLLRDTFPPTIRVSLKYAPDLWSVSGDPTQIHQVLMNLCVNAQDAMSGGGQLSLTLENFVVDQAFAQLRGGTLPGDYVRLTVADTGSGMSAQVKAKIFEPFFTTKPPGQGTGLGLSTVQSIVREHRGFIEVESQPGAGTRFLVYLPATEKAPVVVSGGAPTTPRGNGELILVVDDEHSVREIVRAVLEAYGYRTLIANDGIDAVSKFAVRSAEVVGVIADLSMPYLDGIACSRALRNIAPRLPILLLSGKDKSLLPVPAMQELGLAFLAKPFTREQLLALAHDVFVSALPAGIAPGAERPRV